MNHLWKKLWKVALLLSLAAALVTFQNCSQPASTGGSVAQQATTASLMPFAYDATIDQIAYMSCPQLTTGSFDTDTYFSYRVGAYRNAGMKFSDTFLTTYGTQPITTLTNTVSQSAANANTNLQLAIRSPANLNSVVSSSGSPVQGIDFYNMYASLGSVETTTALYNSSYNTITNLPTEVRSRTLRAGNKIGLHMEGTLQLGISEAQASSLRDDYFNTTQAVLALTYVEPVAGGSSAASTTNVRSPATAFPTTQMTNASQAYGLGFQLHFAQPTYNGLAGVGLLGLSTTGTRTQQGSYPDNVLTAVTEENLLNNGTAGTGTWVCPTDLQFRIVRNGLDITQPAPGATPTDGTIPCARMPDPDSSVMSNDLQIARNSLRVEDWYIDMADHCIIPKNINGSCYGTLNYVNYDFTNTAIGCDPNSSSGTNGNGISTPGSNPICMAWASICYRTN